MAAFPDSVTLDLRLEDAICNFVASLSREVEIADVLDQTGSFSLEAWVKPDGLPGTEMRVISKDTGSAGWALGIGAGGARTFRFTCRELTPVNTDSSAILEVGQWQHLAAVFDTTANTVTLYWNGEQVGQSTGVTGDPTGTTAILTIGSDQEGGQYYFDGKIRDVRIWNDARSQAEVQANFEIELTGAEANLVGYWKLDEGSGTTANDSASTNDGQLDSADMWVTAGGPFWTDVLGDVRAREGVRVRYGILSQEETDRVGGTGNMEFWLKNDVGNSGGLQGYYSPDHANARAGFELGIEARLALTESSVRYVKHRGRLGLIDPEPGIKRARRSKVQSLDWMAAAALHKMDLLALGKNVRSDVMLGNIIDNVPIGPVKRSLATGQETFAYAGDDLRDERVTAYAGMSRVTMSEFGFGFNIGDTNQGGLVKWQDRHERVKNKTVEVTFTQADLVDMTAPRTERHIRNRVEAITFPREVGASPEVLYQLQTTIQINPGESRTIKGRFTDPSNRDARIAGDNMITPVQGTDYEFSSSTGGGGDLNADLGITATYGATTVQYLLTNNGGTTGHVTILQARGDAIRIYDPVESTAEDLTSQSDHFKRIERLRLSYQDDPLVGQDFADNVLSRRSAPKTRLETFTIPGHRSQAMLNAVLTLEPGDRISVSESVTAVSEEFFINGVELFLEPTDQGVAVTATYWVTPASTEEFWLLGTAGNSELGTTTVLGF